ncbi:MAG: hypothetical protein P8Y34_10080 [Anaerolineales bacterium]
MSEVIYKEEIRSNLTTIIFASLSLACLTLFAWRYAVVGWKFTPGLFCFLGLFFLFYTLNYRTLEIQISSDELNLKFGLVKWTTVLENIDSWQLDDSPWWIKYGGAGVHFAAVRGKYRAYFNFLEYPRVLVTLQEKQGWVRQLCFTTRQPDQVQVQLQNRSETHDS